MYKAHHTYFGQHKDLVWSFLCNWRSCNPAYFSSIVLGGRGVLFDTRGVSITWKTNGRRSVNNSLHFSCEWIVWRWWWWWIGYWAVWSPVSASHNAWISLSVCARKDKVPHLALNSDMVHLPSKKENKFECIEACYWGWFCWKRVPFQKWAQNIFLLVQDGLSSSSSSLTLKTKNLKEIALNCCSW